VSVVIQAIEALRSRGLGAQVIVGHSMGGLTVQAVQEALLAQSRSLAALDIRRAILLAPVPPTGRPWVRPPAADLSSLVKMTAELGSYIEVPAPIFIASNFSTLAGTPVANAPTAEQVDARGYAAIEPLLTTLQLVEDPGVLPLKRPMVRAGAFSPEHGTTLTLVSFSQDTLVPASNLPDLYAYLTGDAKARDYVALVADDAVHAMFVSKPEAVVRPLRKAF
jgi:pimeloyl-ACP methyl ester carboxylesterase